MTDSREIHSADLALELFRHSGRGEYNGETERNRRMGDGRVDYVSSEDAWIEVGGFGGWGRERLRVQMGERRWILCSLEGGPPDVNLKPGHFRHLF